MKSTGPGSKTWLAKALCEDGKTMTVKVEHTSSTIPPALPVSAWRSTGRCRYTGQLIRNTAGNLIFTETAKTRA